MSRGQLRNIRGEERGDGAWRFAILLCLSTVALVQAQSLPSAKPEQVGLSTERLNKVTAMLKADVEKEVIPGAILLVARHGKIAWFDTVGPRTPRRRPR